MAGDLAPVQLSETAYVVLSFQHVKWKAAKSFTCDANCKMNSPELIQIGKQKADLPVLRRLPHPRWSQNNCWSAGHKLETVDWVEIKELT